jgi:hypothetical protein
MHGSALRIKQALNGALLKLPQLLWLIQTVDRAVVLVVGGK